MDKHIPSSADLIEDSAHPKLVRVAALADFREFFLLIRRKLPLLVTTTALATSCALGLSLTLPQEYKASSMIIIDPRRTQITEIQDVVTGLNAMDNETVRSEINILKSRAIVNRVMAAEGVIEGINEDREARAQSLSASAMRAIRKQEAPPRFSMATQDEQTRLADHILSNMSVFNDSRSYTITISYQAGSPELAAKIANAFADGYIMEQIEGKYAAAERADQWLMGRIDEMRSQVEKAERAVEEFKIAHDLIGVDDASGTITRQQLIEVNRQLLEARASQAEILARLQSTEKILREKGNIAAATMVLSSPLIQSLQSQEAEVRRREAELASRYGERHPSMMNARAQLADIRLKISEEVDKIMLSMRNEADAAEARIASLQRELNRLEGTSGRSNQDMVTLRQLEREAAAQRTLYESFLERSKQISEQRDLQTSDARVIAYAVPPRLPFFPRKSLFGVVGILLGGLIGLIIVLIAEYFDRGFRSMNEIEQIAQVPCIGMIPVLRQKNSRAQAKYILDKPLSAYAEALRTVHTAVHFINAENPAKIVMVTSSVPHEGKTTLTLGLGRLMARTGQKVLIIDADLRHPRLHDILRMDNKNAHLAGVLQGTATVAEAIQKDESGADILPGRSTGHSPQNLLGSPQMQTLLNKLRPKYDLILLDTPPVLAVADVARLAHMVDASIYAVKWGDTPYDVVLHGLKLIKTFKIQLAGVVLTQVNLKKQSKYGYGDYGHYYGHYSKYYTN